jgi:hypothetical protein
MADKKHSDHRRAKPPHQSVPGGTPPNWKRAHHDWRFWAGLVLMLTAITIYVLSDDLAFVPRSHPRRTTSGAVGT